MSETMRLRLPQDKILVTMFARPRVNFLVEVRYSFSAFSLAIDLKYICIDQRYKFQNSLHG